MTIIERNGLIQIIDATTQEIELAIKQSAIKEGDKLIVRRRGIEFPIGSIDLWSSLFPIQIINQTEKPSVNIDINKINELPVTLRDYQIEAVKSAISHRRGWIQLPTGTGKTYVMAGIILALGKPKTLILTPTQNLTTQIQQDLEYLINEYVGILMARYKNIKNITCATYSAFYYHKTDFYDFELLIIDEAHHIHGNRLFYDLMDLNAYFRYGFTATGDVNEKTEKLLTLCFGSNIYSKNIEALQEYLPRINLELYEINYRDPRISLLLANTSKERKYYIEIINNPYRNYLITDIIKEKMDKNEPTIVLTSQLRHCYTLQKIFENRFGIKLLIVSGHTPMVARIYTLKHLKDYKVLLCTTLFDEGMSIPDIQNIIIASGQASEIKAIQRIGRGTRGFPEKHSFTVIDFIDNFSKNAMRRTVSRLKAYDNYFKPTSIKRVQFNQLEDWISFTQKVLNG